MAWVEYMRWEKDLPTCVPEGLKALIGSMVRDDPAKRPTPGQALANTWLAGAMEQVEKQRRWQQRQEQQRREQQRQEQQRQEQQRHMRGAAQAAAAVSRTDAWW